MALLGRRGRDRGGDICDQLTVDGLSAEREVALLTAAGLTFSEVSAHRASMEEAYPELTRDAVEFRAPG